MQYQSRSRFTAYLFSFPAIVLMILVLIIPIFVAGLLSFTDYSLGNSDFQWVAWKNYEKIFSRTVYQKMFVASLTYVAIVVPISIALGLGAALLIHSLKFGKDIYKTIYFLPVMAALLAMAIVWQFALHPTLGVINQFLSIGCDTFLESWKWYADSCQEGFPVWFGEKQYALPAICFIGIWQGFGFNMVLYLAGLTSVPQQLYDAAEMDGAHHGWDRFRLVTWPMLGPTTVFVVTITSIRSFQVFDTVEAITAGGPSKTTYVMMYAIYEKAIKQNLMGIGATITIIFLAFVLILTFSQQYFVDRKVHYS